MGEGGTIWQKKGPIYGLDECAVHWTREFVGLLCT